MTKEKILMASALGSQPPPTPAGAPAPRKLTSWIESFVKYTEVFNSPEVFRRWAAIGIVAGALEQKVWVRTKGSDLFQISILFLLVLLALVSLLFLVSLRKFLRAVPNLFVAPSSVSDASLIDSPI
jgi:hypothetical protein